MPRKAERPPPKRRKAQGEATPASVDSREVSPSEAKRAWARLIKQVYEVDPLVCPKCAGAMPIVAFIERPEIIGKILLHLGRWPSHTHSPPAGVPGAVSLATGRIAACSVDRGFGAVDRLGRAPLCPESPGADPAHHTSP